MNLNTNFFICENPDSMPGPGIVLWLHPPYWCGKVVQFKSDDELAHFKANSSRIFFQCSGYRIGLIIIGSLENVVIHSDNNNEPFQMMADYFLTNKILKNGSYYKRYKQED
jgi:hypothetical protein